MLFSTICTFSNLKYFETGNILQFSRLTSFRDHFKYETENFTGFRSPRALKRLDCGSSFHNTLRLWRLSTSYLNNNNYNYLRKIIQKQNLTNSIWLDNDLLNNFSVTISFPLAILEWLTCELKGSFGCFGETYCVATFETSSKNSLKCI